EPAGKRAVHHRDGVGDGGDHAECDLERTGGLRWTESLPAAGCDVHADRDVRVLTDLEDRVPVVRVVAGETDVGGLLGQGYGADPTFEVALDLLDRELRIPKLHDRHRDEHVGRN